MSDPFRSVLDTTKEVKYPLIEVRSYDPLTGHEQLVQGCLFHDLLGSDDMELSWMGGCILGNMIQGFASGQLSRSFRYRLGLQMAPKDEAVWLPWPGMPNGDLIPLDFDKLPFDHTMFLDSSDYKFKRRIDRVQQARRIQEIWVPYLKDQMRKHGAYKVEDGDGGLS